MGLIAPLTRLQEAVAAWIRENTQEMRLATGTLRKYGGAIEAYAEHAERRGLRSWHDADRALALSFIGRVADAGGAPATARVHLAAIRAFHGWLADHGLGSDPTRTLRAARRSTRLPATLTEAEVAAMVLLPVPGILGLRDRAIMELAYSTGARAAEMTGLAIGSLDLERRSLVVRGKGDKERTALLTETAVDALNRWLHVRKRLAKPGVRLVFVNNRGTALSGMGLWKLVQRRARLAGITRKVHPHMLRHSFATHLLQRGADVRAIQLLLGHSSIATTQAYLRVDDAWLRSVHGRFHPSAARAALKEGEDP